MSRKVLILANVGSRDVLYHDKPVIPAREKGKELLGRYREVAPKITLPILAPSIRYIESLAHRYPEVSAPGVDRTLRLFCSDQEDPEYRAGDTIELAGIVKKKLLEEFSGGKKEGLRFTGKSAIFLTEIHSNPSRYDRMHGFYEDFFNENRFIRNPEEHLCFVLTSGGTPAMNAMLLLHSVRHFGPNCVQVYVSPGEEARSLRVGAQIAQTDARRRFNEALAAGQFRAAAKVAEDAFEGASGRAAACRYAEHRLAFDFEQARESLESSLRAAKQPLEGYLDGRLDEVAGLEADAVPDRDKKRLLAELFYNLEMKYRSGEFVDALGRVFRLHEALLTQTVEQNTKIRTGAGKKLSDQAEAVDAVLGLRAFLKGKKVRLESEINRHVLVAVVEHLASPGAGLAEGYRGRAEKLAAAAKGIEKLASLRNRSVLGHGFEGVSEEDIVREYGSETLVEDLRRSMGAALGADLSANPFLELSEKLKF